MGGIHEMVNALSEWGYKISRRSAETVFHLFDRDPGCDKLSDKEVYLAMYVLVGIRGGVSSKALGNNLSNFSDDELNAASTGGTTNLMLAANIGDLQQVKGLVAKGVPINAKDDYGWTALRHAVRRGRLDITNELIQLDADVDLASASGRTPLMSAVANNSVDVVKLLLQGRADPSLQNRDGLTACDIACRDGDAVSSEIQGLVKPQGWSEDSLLHMSDEELNLRGEGGTTKLMAAANAGYLERLRRLLAAGASANVQDDYGWTALRYAVRKGRVDTMRELIRADADVDLASTTGRTPLMSAVAHHNVDVVKLLVEGRADIMLQSQVGLSAYDLALRGGAIRGFAIGELLSGLSRTRD